MWEFVKDKAPDFDLYILARYAHKIGMDILTDEEYDTLDNRIRTFCSYHPLVNENWEEDDEPTELAKEYGIIFPDLRNSVSDRIKKYSRYLSYQHAISIMPCRDYNDAHNWFETHTGIDLIFMLKIDGIHLTSLSDSSTGEVVCVSSRARKVNSQILDYTDTFLQVYENINYNNRNNSKFNLTHFECFCDSSSLDKLRNTQGVYYKTEKSAALGLLTRGMLPRQKKYLRLYALRGDCGFKTLSEDLTYLKYHCGFQIPPYIIKQYTPSNFNTFLGFVTEIQEYLITIAKKFNIPYDGIVVQVNNNSKFYSSDESGNYSKGNIALKFGLNAAKTMIAKVKEIKLEPSKERLIPKLILYPTTSPDGKIITEISGYNLRQLVCNKIYPESYVGIKWQSDAIPILDI